MCNAVLLDVNTDGMMKAVSSVAADSGGTGFKHLVIQN